MHSDDIKFFDKSKKVGEITLRAILATILDRHGIRSLKAIPEVWCFIEASRCVKMNG